MSVQELVSETTVKRFDLGVLSWLSRVDEMQNNAAIGAPLEHFPGCKLASVVEANSGWKTLLVDDVVQLTNDCCARKRIIDFEGEAFPSEIIDDVHRANSANIG